MNDRYHHGDLRNALLDAVEKLVDEAGVAAVTLRGAARQAGVSHSAPAHHFGDKRGLLTAFAARGFRRFRDMLREAFHAAAPGGPAAQFGAIGIAYVRFAVENRAYFDVMFRTEMLDQEDPELREASEAAFDVLMDTVTAFGDGDLGPADPLHVAIAAWANVHGLATLWLNGAISHFTDQDVFSIMQGMIDADQTRQTLGA